VNDRESSNNDRNSRMKPTKHERYFPVADSEALLRFVLFLSIAATTLASIVACSWRTCDAFRVLSQMRHIAIKVRHKDHSTSNGRSERKFDES
jgi:hypothetical protein